MRVSGRIEDAQAQQIEFGAVVHGALDELQAVDASFDRAVAPGLLKSSQKRGLVTAQMSGEVNEWRYRGSITPSKPGRCILLSEEALSPWRRRVPPPSAPGGAAPEPPSASRSGCATSANGRQLARPGARRW